MHIVIPFPILNLSIQQRKLLDSTLLDANRIEMHTELHLEGMRPHLCLVQICVGSPTLHRNYYILEISITLCEVFWTPN
jgi:hypothetical protein